MQYSVCCVCRIQCVLCTVQTSCGCSTAWTPSSLSSSSTSSRCTECRCAPRWWPERSILVSLHHMVVSKQHYLVVSVDHTAVSEQHYLVGSVDHTAVSEQHYLVVCGVFIGFYRTFS